LNDGLGTLFIDAPQLKCRPFAASIKTRVLRKELSGAWYDSEYAGEQKKSNSNLAECRQPANKREQANTCAKKSQSPRQIIACAK